MHPKIDFKIAIQMIAPVLLVHFSSLNIQLGGILISCSLAGRVLRSGETKDLIVLCPNWKCWTELQAVERF